MADRPQCDVASPAAIAVVDLAVYALAMPESRPPGDAPDVSAADPVGTYLSPSKI